MTCIQPEPVRILHERPIPRGPAPTTSSAGPCLRIGILAPPWVPVPPPVYGGTELVVDMLARGLVARGHHVELFTTGDSTCPVPRRWHFSRALDREAERPFELDHIAAAYASFGDVDVVHDHTSDGPVWADVLRPGLPVVTTNHGVFSPAAIEHYASIADRVPVIAISHHQRRTAPTVPIAAVIHHGIDVDAIPAGSGQGGYVLFLGRMSPDKGAHRAIQVARAAGKHLIMAAKMWEPGEKEYFAQVVEPMLGDDATYIGQIGGRAKYDLIGGAEALLNPIRWPEPFGLVMTEALACGTPVIAFPEGAAPEIVEHGRTGFLCEDEDDMVRRLAQVGGLDRAACRASTAERFSVERYVDAHVALYRRVLAAGEVHSLRAPA